jgi:lipase
MTGLTLQEIARALLPVIEREGRPVHLVGHSFGGAVALRFASIFPGKVESLTLIESAAFNLIQDQMNQLPLTQAVRSSRVAMAEGDAWNSMRIFIDYWNGDGAWNRTSHSLRQRLAAMVGQVHRDYEALASDPISDRDAAGVVCPTLVLTGDNSPLDMSYIVAALEAKIPFLLSEVISGAGHMAPLTDPHIIDPKVGEFIAKVEFGWQSSAIAA